MLILDVKYSYLLRYSQERMLSSAQCAKLLKFTSTAQNNLQYVIWIQNSSCYISVLSQDLLHSIVLIYIYVVFHVVFVVSLRHLYLSPSSNCPSFFNMHYIHCLNL